MTRLGRWWVRHRWAHPVHRLFHRGINMRRVYNGSACLICRAVWAWYLSDAERKASLDRGIADHEAGRWYRYDTKTGISTPNPDWPKDGPQPGDERVDPVPGYRDEAKL